MISRRLMQMQVDEEYAEHALVAVAGASRAEELASEVDRRTALFLAAERTTVEGIGDRTPRCAALRSVARDVAIGRLS